VLFAVQQGDPNNAGLFRKEVCDFLKEMRDAFLEVDEE